MGANLPATGRVPSFIVQAVKDAHSANLDRAQIIKGWLDADGLTHEKIFEVAWSGDRAPDEDGRLPPVGNTVDPATASYSNEIGSAELVAIWRDPEFDPTQSAFYYLRVLEIPTPRHSLYDKVALGQGTQSERGYTIQERAYSSPIWYTAEAVAD